MAGEQRVKTTITSKTAATVPPRAPRSVIAGDDQQATVRATGPKLTEKEWQARRIKKYATTTSGFIGGFGNRTADGNAYSSGGAFQSQFGNFYSPQLSTDFLEKPQNLRERRAWYRHFYASNEFVRQAIDLHTKLPLSKIRLEKPKCENPDLAEYVYSYFVEMCDEIKLTKTLLDISHDYNLLGNTLVYAEDHNPYDDEDKKDELKAKGRMESSKLFEQFKIVDKDPNYKGWRKLIILPPDQVRIKKIPLSDEALIEFLPDPETRKAILRSQSTGDLTYIVDEKEQQQTSNVKLPERIVSSLKESGAIPMDTDPYAGSFVYHIARQKSQYEILGVSILECCVNTLLLQDKLRQAQTSIASRHMTPIRIVWAEGMSDADVDNLREQVDMALVDPDFSIVANYQINWEEMGSNGRLLELSSEYEHIENSLFAGLGVTREILTGEGTYAGNRVTLEVMNSQYLMFREELQDYVENYLFKPIAKKKGFVEKDKYGRERLIYPSLSFTRLAIRDNDTFFDQVMQLYNKGSVSIDVILDMLNIDPSSTRKKNEADLFTVNDFAFNQLMVSVYQAAATKLAEQFDVAQRVASYLDLHELPPPPPGAEAGGLGGLGGMPRFASEDKNVFQKLSKDHQDAINSLVKDLLSNPEKLEKVAKLFKDQNNGTKTG